MLHNTLKPPPRLAALLKNMDAKLHLPRQQLGGPWSYYRVRSLLARTAAATALLLFLIYTLRPQPVPLPAPSRRIFRTAGRIPAVGASSGSPSAAADQIPSEVDRVRPITNATRSAAESSSEQSHMLDCGADVAHLAIITEKYGLDTRFDYFKRYVRFTRQPIERAPRTTLQQKFIPSSSSSSSTGSGGAPGFHTIDIANGSTHEACGAPLEVPVTRSPFPATADLSDFMFAVSTTYDRLVDPSPGQNPIREWAYWLTDSNGRSNGGKLLLQVMGANDTELDHFTDRLARAGIDADVAHSDARVEMAVRYLDLAATLYRHKEAPTRRWLVLCDDDTFFPSPHALIAQFKRYNHERPLYVGTLSEDAMAVQMHGSQAFGGGGVFLTLPLARTISRVLSTCKTPEKIKESDSGYGPQGDILLRKCIYENTGVRLTQLRDLWQLDLFGDAAGFYESGVRPLSVHHYRRSWHEAYPLDAARLAHTCGEDCTLQRFVTADGFVLSAGFSVAHYPGGLGDIDLDQVEGTWEGSNMPGDGWKFDLMLGPQRPRLSQTGRKMAWELREARNGADGSVTQVYIRKKDDWRWTVDGEPMSDTDGIIELVWVPS